MTTEPLPAAAQAEHLTEVLRKSGVLDGGRVADVAVESSRTTILSRIIRLRLTCEGATADMPHGLVLKTGLPAYMMALHWYPDLRRAFERPLLDYYHAELMAHGVTGYDRRALDDDYRLSALWHITMPVWQEANKDPTMDLVE